MTLLIPRLILTPVIAILVFYFGFKKYLRPPTIWCRSNRCLLGKTALITGANTGIGFQVALKLASRGAKVILACRNEEKGEAARRKIIEETDNKNIFLKIVDFSSFRSIRNFVKELNESENRLDILVNNAGVFGNNEKTEDGFDSVMQINYYSQFLVTVLLLGLMKKSGEASRIVNTSSLAAKYANNFDVHKIHNYTVGDLYVYANSKLCNILFTKELAKRVKSTNITTYSVHPGTIKSDLFRSTKGIIQLIINLLNKPTEEGAETTVYCAVEKKLEKYNGHHFHNCNRVDDYNTAKSEGLPQKLWEITEKIVGLKEEEKIHLDF